MVDMQRSIEAMCLSLLTRQQPVARDMRLVSAAQSLHRIMDHILCLFHHFQKQLFLFSLRIHIPHPQILKKEMMQAIREQNLDADRVVDYLMMAKYLEKVGDHAVNIAQWAIFRMTGDMEGVKLY